MVGLECGEAEAAYPGESSESAAAAAFLVGKPRHFFRRRFPSAADGTRSEGLGTPNLLIRSNRATWYWASSPTTPSC